MLVLKVTSYRYLSTLSGSTQGSDVIIFCPVLFSAAGTGGNPALPGPRGAYGDILHRREPFNKEPQAGIHFRSAAGKFDIFNLQLCEFRNNFFSGLPVVFPGTCGGRFHVAVAAALVAAVAQVYLDNVQHGFPDMLMFPEKVFFHDINLLTRSRYCS